MRFQRCCFLSLPLFALLASAPASLLNPAVGAKDSVPAASGSNSRLKTPVYGAGCCALAVTGRGLSRSNGNSPLILPAIGIGYIIYGIYKLMKKAA